MATKKAALGRGLGALLNNSEGETSTDYNLEEKRQVNGSVAMVPIDSIDTNPFQPRSQFEKEALEELAASISEHGIIQPVTVRKMGYGKFQLISGERRFRASKLAGMKEIPAYIRIANDQSMLEMALVENLQRENLDAIEVAISFKRLLQECSLTQEALSEKVSKKRSTVTNYLRLLKLPAEIQLGIRTRQITMGHARALVNIEDEEKQLELFNQIIAKELSVRNAEDLARENQVSATLTGRKPKKQESLSFVHQKLQEDLSESLKTNVELKRNSKGKGRLTISFKSDEELERIIEFLNS